MKQYSIRKKQGKIALVVGLLLCILFLTVFSIYSPNESASANANDLFLRFELVYPFHVYDGFDMLVYDDINNYYYFDTDVFFIGESADLSKCFRIEYLLDNMDSAHYLTNEEISVTLDGGGTSMKEQGMYKFTLGLKPNAARTEYNYQIYEGSDDTFELSIVNDLSVDYGFIGYSYKKPYDHSTRNVYLNEKVVAIDNFTTYGGLLDACSYIANQWYSDLDQDYFTQQGLANFINNTMYTGLAAGEAMNGSNAPKKFIIQFEPVYMVEALAKTQNISFFDAEDKWGEGGDDDRSLFYKLDKEQAAIQTLMNNIETYCKAYCDATLGRDKDTDVHVYSGENTLKNLYYCQAGNDGIIYVLPTGTVSEVLYSETAATVEHVGDSVGVFFKLNLDTTEFDNYSHFPNAINKKEDMVVITAGRIEKVAIAYDNRDAIEVDYLGEKTIIMPLAVDIASDGAFSTLFTNVYDYLYVVNTPFMFNGQFYAYFITQQLSTEIGKVLPFYNTMTDPSYNLDNTPLVLQMSSPNSIGEKSIDSSKNVYASLSDAESKIKAVYEGFVVEMGEVQKNYYSVPIYYCLDMLKETPSEAYKETVSYTIVPRVLKEGALSNYSVTSYIETDLVNPSSPMPPTEITPYDFAISSYTGFRGYDMTDLYSFDITYPESGGAMSLLPGYDIKMNAVYHDENGNPVSVPNPILMRNEDEEEEFTKYGPCSRYDLLNFSIELSRSGDVGDALYKYNVEFDRVSVLAGLYQKLQQQSIAEYKWCIITRELVEFPIGNWYLEENTVYECSEIFYDDDGTSWNMVYNNTDYDTLTDDDVRYIKINRTRITKGRVNLIVGESMSVAYGNDIMKAIGDQITVQNIYARDDDGWRYMFVPIFDIYQPQAVDPIGKFIGIREDQLTEAQLANDTSLLTMYADCNNSESTQFLPSEYQMLIDVGNTFIFVKQRLSDGKYEEATTEETSSLYSAYYDSVSVNGETMTQQRIPLIITQGVGVLGVNAQSKSYGDSDPDLTGEYTITGVRDSDISNVRIIRASGEAIGGYQYGLSFDDSISSYYSAALDENASNTLTINKLDLVLPFAEQSRFSYDGVYSGDDNYNNDISVKSVSTEAAPYFSIPYGVFEKSSLASGNYYYTLTFTYTHPFASANVGSTELRISIVLKVSTLDAGSRGYIDSIAFITTDSTTNNASPNINLSCDFTSQLFEIAKRKMLIDFSESTLSSAAEKVFDDTQLVINLTSGSDSGYISYTAKYFPYDEGYTTLTVKGYYGDAQNDSDTYNNKKFGNKYLFVTDVLMSSGNASNYEFLVINKTGAIAKREYYFVTGADTNNNVKVYDGSPYILDFYASMMYNLVSGHYLATPSFRFESVAVLANSNGSALSPKWSGNFVIMNTLGEDVSENYTENTTSSSYGHALILHRSITLHGKDIEVTYIGANFYIDVETGKMYSVEDANTSIGEFDISYTNTIVNYVDMTRDLALSAIQTDTESGNTKVVHEYESGGTRYVRFNLSNSSTIGLDADYYYIESINYGTIMKPYLTIRNVLSAIDSGAMNQDNLRVEISSVPYRLVDAGSQLLQLGVQLYYLQMTGNDNTILSAVEVAEIAAAYSAGTFNFAEGDTSIDFQGNTYILYPATIENGIIASGAVQYFRIEGATYYPLISTQNDIYARSTSSTKYAGMRLNSELIPGEHTQFFIYNKDTKVLVTEQKLIATMVKYISQGKIVLSEENEFVYDGDTYVVGSPQAFGCFETDINGDISYYFIDITSTPTLVTDTALFNSLKAMSGEFLIHSHKIYRRVAATPENGVFLTDENYYYVISNNSYALIFGEILAENDSITGNLISNTYNAGITYMREETAPYIISVGGENKLSKYDLTLSVDMLIRVRDVEIDLTKSSFSLEKIYDGELFSITIGESDDTESYVSGLLYEKGHYLTATIAVADANAEEGKTLILMSNGLAVYDDTETSMTANYSITLKQNATATIHKRKVTVNIYGDTENALNRDKDNDGVWDKDYDKSVFSININKNMFSLTEPTSHVDGAPSIMDAHNVSSLSIFKTADANVFTLENGEVKYDGTNFVLNKRLIGVDTIAILDGGGNNITLNYDITFSEENIVRILPREISVDFSKSSLYSSLSFTYQGYCLSFGVTLDMIANIVSGDTIANETAFVSSQKGVGENILVNIPTPGVLINYSGSSYGDAVYSLNYDISYAEKLIEITQREIQISADYYYTASERTKIYDGDIYSAVLTNGMSINNGSTSGLIAGHNISGMVKTADAFVAFSSNDVTSKKLIYENIIIYDEDEAAVQSNYRIVTIDSYATITKRTLNIMINAAGDVVQTKVYDAKPWEIALTNALANKGSSSVPENEGLISSDNIISEQSYRQTISDSFGNYTLNSIGAQGGTGVIVIRADAHGETNLAANYAITYINDKIEIEKRKLIITVKGTEGYYDSTLNGIFSGFSSVYNAGKYKVNYEYYFDNGLDGMYEIDGENNYGLVNDGTIEHKFSGGERITETDVNGKILLANFINPYITSSGTDVTSNYDYSFADSYYEITKRPIYLDVSLVSGGTNQNYIFSGDSHYYEYAYNRLKYLISLTDFMVVTEGDNYALPAGHRIGGGSLTTADAEVLRAGDGTVLPKSFVWGDALRIVDGSNTDVTANYIIDANNTNENFEERFVKYLPRVLVIDIGVPMPVYTKSYDGKFFERYITSDMAVNDKLGVHSGLVGNVDNWGTVTDRDKIVSDTGKLVSAGKDVLRDGSNNVIAHNFIYNNGLEITSPDGLSNRTHNYDIYVYNDIKSIEIWDAVYAEIKNNNEMLENTEYKKHLPTVTITPKEVSLALNSANKLRKYYDGNELDITVEYVAGTGLVLKNGNVITENLTTAVSIQGFVLEEGMTLRIYGTAASTGALQGAVGSLKPTYFDRTSLTMATDTIRGNYSFTYTDSTSIILPRPIVVDINQNGNPRNSAYVGNYIYLAMTAEMLNVSTDSVMQELSSGNGLALVSGQSISQGSLRSEGMNCGINYMLPKPSGNTDSNWTQITIMSGGDDVTSQYLISYKATNSINITPLPVSISLRTATSKVYDGKPLELVLSADTADVSGLIGGHNVSAGTISTLEAGFGTHNTVCNLQNIRITAVINGIETDVTGNYTFTYVGGTVKIEKRGLYLRYNEEYKKAQSTNIFVELLPRHYEFYGLSESTGPCSSDDLTILSYKVKNPINSLSGFPSNDIDEESIILTIYDVNISNQNYYIVSKESISEVSGTQTYTYNANSGGGYTLTESTVAETGTRESEGFTIPGTIIIFQPRINIIDNEQQALTPRFEGNGVEFVYDGKAKAPLFTLTGLYDESVRTVLTFEKMVKKGENLSDALLSSYDFEAATVTPPTSAGLYRVLVVADADSDYNLWVGTYIYMLITPATPVIAFAGSTQQTYGSVVDIAATVSSIAGLYMSLDVLITPMGSGYTYPQAGTYTLKALFEGDGTQNYVETERSIEMIIKPKELTVSHDGQTSFVYDGTVKALSIALDKALLTPSDVGIITDNNISVSTSGTGSSLLNAGEYVLTLALVGTGSHNYYISNDTIAVKIEKRALTVSVLVNGVARLTIDEGTEFSAVISYSGFANNESVNNLTTKAYLPNIPKTALNEYEIAAKGASSNNYVISYVSAYLTILANKVSELATSDTNAIVQGAYSSYSSLTCVRVEADMTNATFYEIYSVVESKFANSELLSEFSAAAAYKLSIVNDDSGEGLKTIKLRLTPNLEKASDLMLLSVNEKGETSIINAYIEDGYIVFTASEVCSYVVFVPKSGLSTATILLIVIAPIIVILLGVALFSLFRRKY